MSIQQNIWDEFIAQNSVILERLFASSGWKKAFLPWLKAQREVNIRTVLQAKNHIDIDVTRGMALAFEQIMNLPQALDASKKAPPEVPQSTTFYDESIAFEEND